MVAMSNPWKDPRTGIYYIRRGVPANIQSQLGCTEYKRSLKTKNPTEAKALFPFELAKCQKMFDQAKANVANPPLIELSKDRIEQLANAWLSMELEEDEEWRTEGVNERELAKYQESISIGMDVNADQLARGDTTFIEFDMEDFLESNGIHIVKDSNLYKQLAYAFLKAYTKSTLLINQRQQGQLVDTPEAPDITVKSEVASEGDETISFIYEGWKTERKPNPKLEKEGDKVIRRFIECHGDLDIKDITLKHAAKYKDSLFLLPARPAKVIRELPVPEVIKLLDGDKSVKRLAARSVRRDVGILKTICEWAVNNGYREDNPISRVKVLAPKNASEQRLPYDKDDLQIIFNSPIYTEGERPIGGAGEASYWIPILALYTGARLDELGQLLVTDVKQDDGIWHFDFNTLDEGKSLKTESSKRKTPIHDEVLSLKFLDYVSKIKEVDATGQLFPELKPNALGKLTSSFSKWYGRYARTIGITDKRKVFHSFRHTFKRACRDAGIFEEVHDALTGHSGGGVGRSYGAGMSLNRLQEAVNTLSFIIK